MRAMIDILFLALGGTGEIDDKLPPKWGQYADELHVRIII